ncbi:mechanosensitive ion channel [Achromobacter sp. GG226]|uniref:mechanosensitive ion channel n=1 Tax=Verticiella alkaliphila TaxID=2779529 RepID=UPI001C0DE6E8|nr:mechanosensitive ion channel [Verticiella sp. GG226]MBU4609755.1 mechanosensitive ion channel [Verticiella sp. GG226]
MTEYTPDTVHATGQFAYWAPRILGALIILIVTFFAARAARWGITNLTGRMAFFSRPTARPGETLSSSLGTLAYWLVWLLGLLLALQPLGLAQSLGPVHALTHEVFIFLPRILGAALILFVGVLVAGIVRNIVETLLAATGVDQGARRLGLGPDPVPPAGVAPVMPPVNVPTAPGAHQPGTVPPVDPVPPANSFTLSRVIGAVVFTLIIIPVAISALQALGISSVVDPIVDVLRAVLDAVPRVFAAGLLLTIAFFIAQWVRGLVQQILVTVGFDRAVAGSGLRSATPPSRIAGWLALVAIMLFAAVESASLLRFDIVALLLAQVIQLGGQVVFGSLIVVVGVIMARFVARLVGDTVGESGLPSILKYAIIALSVAIGLRFMGLANEIVNLAFGLILGSAAVACALAFGLGGRETAHQLLQRWIKRRDVGTPPSPPAPPAPQPPIDPIVPPRKD